MLEAWSDASFVGLEITFSLPRAIDTRSISLLSVETATESIVVDLSAASIAQPISGLPWKGRRFFPGNRLLPPLAGMSPSTFLPLYIHHSTRPIIQSLINLSFLKSSGWPANTTKPIDKTTPELMDQK
jgi:hypothetical protein